MGIGLHQLVVGLAIGVCVCALNTNQDDRVDRAGLAIDAEGMLAHIKILASDEFDGRAPATPGEDKTVDYLVGQFKKMGLKPGNPDGTYIQQVPLIRIQTSAEGVLRAGVKSIELRSADAWVPVSRRMIGEVEVKDSEVLFVGHGVEAPEYGWDDYKGMDVKGKTLVMLVGDPPVQDPNDPTKLDEAVFKGRAMTYYGRWTYKYEIASKKGAAAVLLIHDTGPAGYPYEVVKGSWGRDNFDIGAPIDEPERVAIEAWVALETAKALLSSCGREYGEITKAALQRDFRPIALGATFSAAAHNVVEKVVSRNVVAKVEGSDPKLKDEYVIFTAHWDHLGRDTSREGDQIFNGAADNASGVAMLLEIADASARLNPPPKRSCLFLVVTAEEKGLLGARYYATHPLYPIEQTLANINMDVINLWGRTSDVTSVGLGQTTLDDVLVECARKSERVVGPDTEPEKGMYYRSDHFEFAKVGVPALNAKGGTRYIGKPEEYGHQKRDEYTKHDYHKPSDEVKPDWDLSGAVEDARLLLDVAVHVADGARWPEWKPGSEFRARREAMLGGPKR